MNDPVASEVAAPKQLARKPSLTTNGLLEVGTFALFGAVLAGWAGRVWWLLELASHFRPHLSLGLVALSVWWLIRRRIRLAIVCCAFCLISFLPVLPAIVPGKNAHSTEKATIRIASINVHTANQRADLLLEFIRQNDPDVVLLMEVHRRWIDELAPLRAEFPRVMIEAREDNFGIALFSRLPWTNAAIVMLGDAEVPSVAARIELADSPVWVLGIHPLPPISAGYAHLRNNQLRAAADWIRTQSDSVVLIGDLNVTPWSPYFAELVRRGGLKNSSPMAGLAGSWPATWPLGRIPLDHCLVSPALEVKKRLYGSRIGGDHLPLLVEIGTGKLTN